MIRSLILAAISLLCAAGRPGEAAACECAGGAPSVLLPRPDATGVPLNTRVLLSADRAGLDAWAGTDAARTPDLAIVARAKKKGGAGKPVKGAVSVMLSEAWGTVYVIAPARPLARKTTYDVVVRQGKKPADWKVISSFTTGDAADTTPPVFAGIEGFTSVVNYRAAVGKCDGKPPFPELTWKYGDATDDLTARADLVRILYVQKKGEQRTIRLIEPFDAAAPVTAVRGDACDAFRPIFKPGDELCASIEVVDLAGNVGGAAVEKCMAAKKM